MDAARSFRLNDWTAHPGRNQLISADGRAVHLEPKVMEVLSYLATRQGEVVRREELLQALWPGVVVGDESLTQAIIKLRKALADSPRHPRYIETIPKRGYRLRAAIGSEADAGALPRAQLAWTARVWPALLVLCAATLVGSSLLPRPALENVLALAAFEATEHRAPHRQIALGLAAELKHELGKMVGVTLAAVPAPTARYALSGEVSSVGEQSRVHVRLAHHGVVVWSARFQAASAELTAQPEILSRRIAAAVSAALREQELKRLAEPYTRSVEAYKLFESGRAVSAWRGQGDGATARELFGKAIAKDPTFARAYAATAVSYVRDVRYGVAQEGNALLARAQALAATASEIAPQLPEARFAMAYVHLHRRDHAAAEKHLEEALRLDPNYADAYGLKAHVYLDLGKVAEAIALVRTAMRLDPDATQIHFLLLGRAYYFTGEASQALINLREARSRNPADIEARLYLALTLAALGEPEEAEWEAEEIRALHPSFRAHAWLQHYPLVNEALRSKLATDLGRLGL